MNNVPLEIFQDLNAILYQLKSKNESSRELALKQLIAYINYSREYIDEIIEEMSRFFDSEKQSIDEAYFYKIITTIGSKLEENNLSTTKFINKIFPILMLRIYYYSQNIPTNDTLLFDMISDITKKCENNTGQIELNLNTVFEKLRDEKNPPDDSTKYALISVLARFLHNAPLISFSKIMKSTNGFKLIISDFKHRDENIRRAVQKLIEEFLLILLNKDAYVRKEKTESIIYNTCIKDFIDKKNNTEFITHGLVLVLKAFTVKKNDKINELFKEKYRLFLDFLYSNLSIDKIYIKISIIETLPFFLEFLPSFFEEKEYLEYFVTIVKLLLNMYSDKRIDENIKSEILITFGKLSLIESIKDYFSEIMLSVFGYIRNDINENVMINENIIDCFSDFIINFGDKFIAVFPFFVYYEKIFRYGLKESHIHFLKNILTLYEKDSKDNIQIIICMLNVISYIITEKEFSFNNTKKQYNIGVQNGSNILSLNLVESSRNNDLNLNEEDWTYFDNIGKVLSCYVKEKKEKGYDFSNEIIIALTLLSFINNEMFEKHILNFYIQKCIKILHKSDKAIKRKIIELANSSWIPKSDNKKKSISDIESIFNYILESFIGLLLNEPDDELKLLILKIFDDERYYKYLSKNNYFANFVSIIEYDNNSIKEKGIEIISKIITYNYELIYTYIREKILQIYLCLVTSNNQYKKEENINLLRYFIKYIGNHIIDEVEKIFPILLKILEAEINNKNNNLSESKKSNDLIVLGILSVISEIIKNDDCYQSQLQVYISDIMSISINILGDNLSTSSIKEETALYTILSILENSKKDWDIYSNYTNLVLLIIQVLSKSQNKKSRFYAMKIFGFIGTINPSKFNNLLDNKKESNIKEEKEDNNNNNTNTNTNNDQEKNDNKIQIFKQIENEEQNNKKYLLNKSILKKEIEKYKKFDFQKAIQDKTLDSNTYYSIQILMKILINNNNYDVSVRIIYLLKDILEKLSSTDYPILYLILPTLLSSINNFEDKTKIVILEILLLIIKSYKEQSLPFIEDILLLSESYITEESKPTIKEKERQQLKDISLDIIDVLCEIYSDEISLVYPRIIPLILGLLSDINNSVLTKRTIISCLTHIGDSLSNYLYLVIPELINCLSLLMNKMKVIPTMQNTSDIRKKLTLLSSYLVGGNYSSNNIQYYNDSNSDNNIRNTITNSTNVDNSMEKSLEQDILNLMDNLIDIPGIIKYMEKIIRILCFYMEASQSCQENIMNMFVKMLNKYQKEFIVFYPYILNFSKRIGMPCLDYFKEFRFGLEKIEIISLLVKEDFNQQFVLPCIGNIIFDDKNLLNDSDSSNDESNSFGNKDNISPYKKRGITKTMNTTYFFRHLKIKPNQGNNRSSAKIQSKTSDVNLNREIVKGTVESLIKEFDTKNCLSEEDWHEWFKNSTKKLFEQSPSYIIFSCHKNNVYNSQIINELYNSAFFSLWKKCDQKIYLVNHLANILKNPKTPKDISLTLLNLIEFITKEGNEQFDSLEFELLGKIADMCSAYAKALYYYEKGYIHNNSYDDLVKLINLYINLELPDNAMGIYILTQKISKTQKGMKSKNNFNYLLNEKNLNLKLHQWQKALQGIEEDQKKDLDAKNKKKLLIKKAICLDGLSDWENLLQLGDELSKINVEKNKNVDSSITEEEEEDIKLNIPLALAKASFNLGEWDKLKQHTLKIKSSEDNEIYEENFYKAIVAIKEEQYEKAKKYINIARDSIDDRIKALLKESYERAYKLLLDNENLCELEDIIELNKNVNKNDYNQNKNKLKLKWNKLLELKEDDIKTYERIIGIRKIIFTPEEDYLSSLRLSQICRKKDKFTTCMLVLDRLKSELKKGGRHLEIRVEMEMGKCIHDNYNERNHLDKAIKKMENIVKNNINCVSDTLKSKIYCYYGMWRAEKIGKRLNIIDVNNILKDLQLSTKYNPNNYKAWHSYALLNYRFYESKQKKQLDYAVNAIEGFTKSICIGGKNMSKILQDLLLLLNIWFQVGMEESIDKLINEKIDVISLESWILVIPQLLARINLKNPFIRNTLVSLLRKIGLKNPRSLTYPLTVLQKSKSKARAEVVSLILEEIKKEHQQLFKECELIVNELNRCALCLHEQWSETIEEGAKLFFQSKDPIGSSKILEELHKTMSIPPKTMNEIHFHQLYRSELNEAHKLLQDYLQNNNLPSYKEAWDIYHSCFRSISNNFSTFECLDLESISPALFNFRESEIEIPGIYQNDENCKKFVKISKFSRKLTVLNSKQHPRKIVIYGSDEKEYPFLLKGHEDIRQDERVMQLFGLVNTLLSKDSDTREKNLAIKRYPVIPLSPNTGIIGWVSNCDTLHQLIKDYRQINNVPFNIEHRLMATFYPRFDSSLSMTKLEVFKYALYKTLGIDLYRVLWNKSQNAEDWLDRRTNYSRSLAVMSIVGYILGLGDRHPSNIMVDRISGKILHIDFGDCFEVAMKRDKFPEKVPFRLTRMLIKALEIGGIEGAFRITCENVMRVVRENKDSLNVILAAFVHDPLISFRLLIPLLMKQAKDKNRDKEVEDKKKEENEKMNKKEDKMMEEIINNKKKDENELEKKRMGSDERQLYNELEEKDDTESLDLNQIAKIVLDRISDKLNGNDFNKNEELKVYEQIQRLIRQATSHENLSQSYLGWCPFW